MGVKVTWRVPLENPSMCRSVSAMWALYSLLVVPATLAYRAGAFDNDAIKSRKFEKHHPA